VDNKEHCLLFKNHYHSYIGIRTIGGPSTYYDDFGGGTLPVAYLPGGSKVLAAYMPPPLRVRAKARPHLARIHKSAMLLTRPAGVIWRSYYYSDSARIAMREDSDQGSEVYYILTDHPSPSLRTSLGSTSVAFTLDENDQIDFISRQWFTPWGETRPGSSVTATDYGFTGQLEDSSIGLYWYRSRWYDDSLGRFISPDTIIPYPNNPTSWNRYTYSRNNPTNRIDPSGHLDLCPDCGGYEIEPPPEMDPEQHNRLLALNRQATKLSVLMKLGILTDVEALAQLMDYATPMYTIPADGLPYSQQSYDVNGFFK